MSIQKTYRKRFRAVVGAEPVWTPGTPVSLGEIMIKEDDEYKLVGNLSTYTDVLNEAEFQEASLDLVSGGTKQRLFQAGVELSGPAALDLSASAKLVYEFNREFQFVLKTPTLKGQHITNLNEIAKAVKSHPDWNHKSFFLVHEVYNAESFSFIASENRGRKFEFDGSGSGILGLLSAGVSVGLTTSSNDGIKLISKGGSLGMGLVRISAKGELNFAP